MPAVYGPNSAQCPYAAAHGSTLCTDDHADTESLAQQPLDEGWLAAPCTLFHGTPRPTTPMRVNSATSQDARFRSRLQTLAAAHRRTSGHS